MYRFYLKLDYETAKQIISCSCYRNVHLANNPIYVSQAPLLPKTPYVSVDQLQKFSVSLVYDYVRISVREGLQEG